MLMKGGDMAQVIDKNDSCYCLSPILITIVALCALQEPYAIEINLMLVSIKIFRQTMQSSWPMKWSFHLHAVIFDWKL